jgi:hypothetical protein
MEMVTAAVNAERQPQINALSIGRSYALDFVVEGG